MLKKIFQLYFILLISSSYGFSKEKSAIDSTIIKFKNNVLDGTLPKFKNKEVLSNLFLYQYLYKVKGIRNDSLLIKDNLENLPKRERIIATYTYGDYLISGKTPNDSLAFYHYKSAFKFAKQEKDTLLVNECLKRICDRLFLNGKDLNLFKEYIKIYQRWKADKVDEFWMYYYETVYKFLGHLEINKQKNTLHVNELNFERGVLLASNSDFFLGLIYQLKGIYYDVFTDEYFKAENEFRQAISNFEKTPYYYSQSCVYGNKVNLGISLFNQNRMTLSIKIFKEALVHENKYYSDRDKMDMSIWLNKAYKKINLIDSAYVYSEMTAHLKEKIDKYNHAMTIKKIEDNSSVREKENVIKKLEKHNNDLSKNIYTLLPILSVVLLTLVFIFYLYKRYKKKSSILEEEQSETLQKLDELKSIVVKNHIVLKDKTKIYISDLLYIKSDDHYLNVFTTDGKKHVVRGKLSQIKEELPPNFTQNHRSYIVNSNFIHQTNFSANFITLRHQDKKTGKEIKIEIPLSRSNKKKF